MVLTAPGLVADCKSDLHRMILWKLRQLLAMKAAGQDVTIKDRCPPVHGDACFDADCPGAMSYGLRKQVGTFAASRCTDAEAWARSRGHSSLQAGI